MIKYFKLPLGYPQQLLRELSKVFGKSFVIQLLNAIARPPSRYYLRVNTLKTTRSALVEKLKRYGIPIFPDEVLDDAIYIKIDNTPRNVPVSEYIVVADKYAAESVLVGANLYIPGVVKFDKDIKRGDYVTIVDPKGHIVGWGLALINSDEISKNERGIAVKTIISRYNVPSLRDLKEYKEGLFYAQSYPAILTSHILDPKPGDIIVDMCAAPGGKTTHLAQLMRNKGVIYAFDKSEKKISAIKENVKRLDITCVKPIVHDSRYIHIDYRWLRVDKVLLDPPCSALGVRPKLYEEKSWRDIIALAEYQKQFLKAAYCILDKGGLLAYSTCTITIHENEHVIKYAVSKLGYRLISQKYFIGTYGFRIEGIDHELVQRFFPHIHDSPGYFIALLEKP